MTKARWSWFVGIVACSGLLAALASSGTSAGDRKKDGDKKEPPKPPEVSSAAKTVKNLSMAFELAKYGQENKVPEAMITAARIIGTAQLSAKRESSLPKDEKPYDQYQDAEDLIAKALKMAEATAEIKILAASTRKIIEETPRGAKGGAFVREGYLGGGQTATYNIGFVPRSYCSITVRNLGRTDLDLYVLCPRTGWTASDRGLERDAFVNFTCGTASTQPFQVRVNNYTLNRGTRYVLFTN